MDSNTLFCPKRKLFNPATNEMFSLYYGKKNPCYVRYWQLFDDDGNVVHRGDNWVEAKAETSRLSPEGLLYMLSYWSLLIAVMIDRFTWDSQSV